jgi:hypothetical protein
MRSPTSSDAIPVANLTWTPQAITADNPEYTGSIHRAGSIVLGATYDVSFDILLRGPGGASPPAPTPSSGPRPALARLHREHHLDRHSGGRGSARRRLDHHGRDARRHAAATADLYKGLALSLSVDGAMPTSLSMIRGYSAAKAPARRDPGERADGQLPDPEAGAYTYAATGTPPVLSLSLWQGNRRYNFQDMAPSSAR